MSLQIKHCSHVAGHKFIYHFIHRNNKYILELLKLDFSRNYKYEFVKTKYLTICTREDIWFIHYSLNDVSIVLLLIQNKEVISCYSRQINLILINCHFCFLLEKLLPPNFKTTFDTYKINLDTCGYFDNFIYHLNLWMNSGY